jgi:hypothetical protein
MYTTTTSYRERVNTWNIERAKIDVPRSYFKVEKINTGMGKYAIVNMENGTKLADVSERYTLVKNEDIFKPFIERFGIENIARFIGYGRGKYSHMRINTGREFNFGTDEMPDIIKEQIVVENSYNKTRSFRFMFGAFRLVCTNGLYTGQCLLKYRKIHVGEIPVQELISNVINNYEQNSFDLWKSFKNVNMTLEQQIKMLETFEAFEIKEENKGSYDLNHRIVNRAKMFLGKNESVDNQRNGWGLFNQLNRAIEIEVSGNSKISQRVKANQKAESFLAMSLNLN